MERLFVPGRRLTWAEMVGLLWAAPAGPVLVVVRSPGPDADPAVFFVEG